MNTHLPRGRNFLAAHPTLNLAGAGIALVAVCYGLARFGYGYFIPVFRAEFNLSPMTVGFFAAASYTAYCAAILAAIALTPALGGRALSIISGLLAALALTAIATAANAAVLGLAVAATGFCTGLVSPPLAALMAEQVAPKYQNRVQTMVNSGAGIGVVLSVPVAMAASSNWRLAWLVFAALAILSTWWIARSSPQRSPRTGSRKGLGGISQLLPRPLLPTGSIGVLLGAAFFGAAGTAMLTFGRDFMVTTGSHPEAATTTAWVLLGACGLLGAVAGNLVTKFGLRTCWIAGCAAMAAAITLFASFPNTALVAVVSMALFGGAYTTASGFLLLWGTKVYQKTPATGVGLAFLLIALAQAVVTPLLGMLQSGHGPYLPFYLTAAIAAGACAIKPHIPPEPITLLMEIIPNPKVTQ